MPASDKDKPFDVVLCDLEMPVMDGLTAIKLIRSEEAAGLLRRSFVIALTGNARQQQVGPCRTGRKPSEMTDERFVFAQLKIDDALLCGMDSGECFISSDPLDITYVDDFASSSLDQALQDRWGDDQD